MNQESGKNNKTSLIILGVILLLAAFLRLVNLTTYPGGFNADEAALGYNAYSILHTGRDEHGAFLPLVFKSFGDYKAPLYGYIDIPFVAVLGLNELAVRLPSALFGVASVFVLYLFVKKIFDDDWVSLVAALFLAISPWHLHFSRGGWEVNVATFFILFGLYAFLKGLERPRWLIASVISFLASLYIYQSPKIIVPLLVVGILALYWRAIWSLRTKLVLPIIVGVVLGVPLIFTVVGGGTARFSGVSIFADTGPFWAINEARGEHADFNSKEAKIFHNKLIGYGLNFLKNYSDHYTADFFFAKGDPIDRNHIPDMGVLYVADAVFLLLGLVFLLQSDRRDKKLVILWLLVAPTAAAITFQTPHALRSANEVVPLMIVAAVGLVGSVRYLWPRMRILAYLWIIVALLGYGFGFAKYLHQYYIHIPQRLPLANNYGFDELVPYLESVKGEYDKILVTDRYDQPYILFLFYSKKDPRSFQQQVVLTPRDKFNFSTVRSYDNYEFREIKPEDLLNLKRTLIVGTEKEIPEGTPGVIKVINFPNGQPAFKIVKT